MAEGHESSPYLDFELDPSSASKRPEQLVILLKRALEQEFPEAFATIEVWHTPGRPFVSVRHLEKLDEQTAKDVAHRARGIFNEFLTSPWY